MTWLRRVAELFPYQVEGAAFLAAKGRALLADEPGLGKTAQAIAAADEVLGYDERLLVICPASVVENWKREIARFAPWLSARSTVVSYNGARTHPELKTRRYGVLILDETHYLKTQDSQRTQAILGKRCDGVGGIVERATNVFLLTGTPMPNNPAELWPWLRAVMPESLIGKKSGRPVDYWPFVYRYCVTEDDALGRDPKIICGRNLAELKARIAPFYLRRKKSDVLPDLPELRTDLLALPAAAPADPGRELGEGAGDRGRGLAGSAAELVREALERGGIEALAAIAPHVATLRRLTGAAKVGPMAEWVVDQLDGGLQKLVIFAVHREVLHGLKEQINKRYGVAVIEGGTTDRQAQVDRFQNDADCRVFVGQIQAAGTGITLTAASDLVFLESDWVPANMEQAAMRIHRIGQRNACMVRFAMIPGSIDEQIAEACRRKLADIQAVFA